MHALGMMLPHGGRERLSRRRGTARTGQHGWGIAAAGLAMGLSMLAPALLAGGSAEEVAATIVQLEQHTASAKWMGTNAAKDLAGLLGKLEDSRTKLLQHEYLDAAGKTGDYRLKTAQLAAEGKLAGDDAAALLSESAAVLSAITGLLTSGDGGV